MRGEIKPSREFKYANPDALPEKNDKLSKNNNCRCPTNSKNKNQTMNSC